MKPRLLHDLEVAEVQVSLEGPQDIHDQIRGAGSFTAALAGVRILLEAGLKVSLNTTLSRLNFPRFPELPEIARGVGVPEVGFSRLVPSGQGQALIKEMLSPGELEDFYRRMLAPPAGDVAVICGDPLAGQLDAGQDRDDQGDAPFGGCSAAIAGLTLLPDGTILPCRRLAIPLGNASRDSLREIWALHPVLTALRDRGRYTGKCGVCARWALSRGCRAVAHAWSQAQGAPDLLAPDPQCFVELGAGPDA
jgi:radical SAM protein with 4Fe4S-binding SPASM domain